MSNHPDLQEHWLSREQFPFPEHESGLSEVSPKQFVKNEQVS
jgi:hypothetical protein